MRLAAGFFPVVHRKLAGGQPQGFSIRLTESGCRQNRKAAPGIPPFPVSGPAPDGIREKQIPSRAYGVDLLPALESMGCPATPP
jgi:hypothetical protein